MGFMIMIFSFYLISTVNFSSFTILFFIRDQKSDDPLSPAYVASIFNFTKSPHKRKAEKVLGII